MSSLAFGPISPDAAAASGYPTSTASGDISASSSTGDQGVLSGLSDIFSSVGTAVSQGVRATQGPQVVGTTGLVYNPATGQYTSPYAVNQSAMSPLLLLLAVGVIAYILLRK